MATRTKSFHSNRSHPDCHPSPKLSDNLVQDQTQPDIQQHRSAEIADEPEFPSRKLCALSISRQIREIRRTLRPQSARETDWRVREWYWIRAGKFLHRTFSQQESAARM